MDKKIILKKLLSFFVDEKDIPSDLENMRLLWDDTFNNIDVNKVSDEVLKLEDQYLRLDILNRGLTNSEKLTTGNFSGNMSYHNSNRIYIWKGDITNIYADIVVNSIEYDSFINKQFNNSVFHKSGLRLVKKVNSIVKDCEFEYSDVFITRGYNLPCDLIIHVLLPNLENELTDDDLVTLKMAYMNILECTNNNMMKIIVVPTLGINDRVKDIHKLAKLAITAIDEYLDKQSTIEKVIISVTSEEEYEIYKELLIGDNNA